MQQQEVDFVTVAICTRDRCDDLAICLASLACQEDPGLPWELVVIDNGSTDGTRAFVESQVASFPVPLRYVFESTVGIAHARNCALLAAQGDILLFVDDDEQCSPGWMAAHVGAYADAEVIATGGRTIPRLLGERPGWFQVRDYDEINGPLGRFEHGDQRAPLGPKTAVGCFIAGNMGLRRARALAVGGFRVDLGWGERRIPCEETELMRRLMRGGGKAWYLPEARLEHRLEASKLSVGYVRQWNLGYGRASVLMKPPRNPFSWLSKVIAQCTNLVRFCPALVMSDRFVIPRVDRKFFQSVGRLAQLFHIPARS